MEFYLNYRKLKNESEIEKKKIIEDNITKLKQVTHEFASIIFSTRFLHSIPFEVRCVSKFIYDLAVAHGKDAYVLVGSFVILRIINPVIVVPDQKGIKPKNGKPPSSEAKRTLILISKLIQSLANEVRFGEKEPYMLPMNSLLEELEERFHKFLHDVCASKEDLEQYSVYMKQMVEQKIKEKAIDNNPEWKAMAIEVQTILSDHMERFVENMNLEDGLSLKALLESLPAINDNSLKSGKSSSTSDTEVKYAELLERAQREDLSDLEKKNLLSIRGRDKQGRPVAVFTEHEIEKQDLDRVVLYLIRSLDKFVEQDYVLLYCINNEKNTNRPGVQWMLQLYKTITRKYKKNLKALYLVHPSWIYKMIIKFFRPFVSDKFWKKLKLVSDVNIIYNDIDPFEVPLAPQTLAHNVISNKSGKKEPIFGVSYDLVVRRAPVGRNDNIPIFFRQILEELESSWCREEGLFRISGRHTSIQELKLLIDNGYFVDYSQCKGHTLTGLVKLFFREMPIPLLCHNSLYKDFLDFSTTIKYSTKDEDEPKQMIFDLDALQSLIDRLPDNIYAITKVFMEFLHVISQHSSINLMKSSNLAVCIAPNLLTNQENSNAINSLNDIPKINKMVTCLIEYAPKIFSRRKIYERGVLSEQEKRISIQRRRAGGVFSRVFQSPNSDNEEFLSNFDSIVETFGQLGIQEGNIESDPSTGELDIQENDFNENN